MINWCTIVLRTFPCSDVIKYLYCYISIIIQLVTSSTYICLCTITYSITLSAISSQSARCIILASASHHMQMTLIVLVNFISLPSCTTRPLRHHTASTPTPSHARSSALPVPLPCNIFYTCPASPVHQLLHSPPTAVHQVLRFPTPPLPHYISLYALLTPPCSSSVCTSSTSCCVSDCKPSQHNHRTALNCTPPPRHCCTALACTPSLRRHILHQLVHPPHTADHQLVCPPPATMHQLVCLPHAATAAVHQLIYPPHTTAQFISSYILQPLKFVSSYPLFSLLLHCIRSYTLSTPQFISLYVLPQRQCISLLPPPHCLSLCVLPKPPRIHQLVCPPPAAMHHIIHPPHTAAQLIDLYALFATCAAVSCCEVHPHLILTVPVSLDEVFR